MTETDVLRWQFGLIWRLAGVHLPRLSDAACLWAPAPTAWSVRRGEDGIWRPDWAEVEPDPPPPASIAWLTWHLIWWWSGVSAAVHGQTPPQRDHVFWPGGAAATVARLEALAADWRAMLEALDQADLARPVAHPWPEPRPLRHTIAWAHAELTKNVAEIGYARLLYEASAHS